jgi:hypothetical protein
MTATFTAQTIRGQDKDTMGLIVPVEVVDRLGKGQRPPVVVTIGPHSWRSTVARMGGQYLVGIAKEHREPAGLTGDETELEVTLALDEAPRVVDVPDDLAAALEAEGLREAFDGLAPSRRKEWVRQVETAKAEATRQRRIEKAVAAAKEKA